MKDSYYKHIFIGIIFVFIFILPVFSLTVLAQNTGTYTVLEPLPGFGDGGNRIESRSGLFTKYLQNAYVRLLQAAAIICVISIMVGGIQYITAAAADTKSAARTRIWNNFIGFLIVLAAYLILRTINPSLVSFQLTIPDIKSPVITGSNGTRLAFNPTTRQYQPITQIPGPQSTLPRPTAGEELAVRQTLENAGFTIYKSPCAQNQTSNCTDVGNLRQATIDGIIRERDKCNCTMAITGGSETGNGHSLPQAGNSYRAHSNGFKVDVGESTAIRNYVKNNYTLVKNSDDGPIYQGFSDGVFVQVIDEGNHFDFLFDER